MLLVDAGYARRKALWLRFWKGFGLTVEDTRFVRAGRRAILAAFASVLLASCSTSNSSDEFFGFSASAHSAAGLNMPRAAAALPSADAGAPQGAVGVFVMDEDDPSLPETVADAPLMRPVSAEEAAALEQQQPAEQAQQVVAASQPEPEAAEAPPDAEATMTPAAAETVPSQPVSAFAAPAEPPRKRGFLATLFGNQQDQHAETKPLAAAAVPAPAPLQPAQPAKPLIQVASTGEPPRSLAAGAAAPRPLAGGAAAQAALPGVRASNSLYEISRRSGLDDNDDIDVYEGEEGVQVASAAGLARLAPNGLLKQTEHVDVACLKPSLVRTLRTIENHFGRKVMVTSGYRSPDRNRRARGARNSLHMYCAAADVQVEGVSKWELAKFVRSMPGRGGVGTYCHTDSVHIDVGPERDWNWRCRRRK